MNKWFLVIVFLILGLVVGFVLGNAGILGQATITQPLSMKKKLYEGQSTTLTIVNDSNGSDGNFTSASLHLVAVTETSTGSEFVAYVKLYSRTPSGRVILVQSATLSVGDDLETVFGLDFLEDPVVAYIGREVETNRGYMILYVLPVRVPAGSISLG